jgi:CRP-like cAMP-binding protein
MHMKPFADPHWLMPTNEPRTLSFGDRTSREGTPIANQVLLALPDPEFQALRSSLTFQPLSANISLHEPGSRFDFLYFPNNGLVSIVVATRDGKTVEVGAVGHEGLLGTPALVGLTESPHRAIVLIEGEATKLPVEAIQPLLQSSPELLRLASLHAVIQGMEAAQSAACNRLHSVEQRLARWLLIIRDRVDQPSLHMTHVSLAAMLGTDRPSVSQAAGALHKKGAIEYARGKVRIIDRKRLEETTCECYEVMRHFDGILIRERARN